MNFGILPFYPPALGSILTQSKGIKVRGPDNIESSMLEWRNELRDTLARARATR